MIYGFCFFFVNYYFHYLKTLFNESNRLSISSCYSFLICFDNPMTELYNAKKLIKKKNK